jgi:hypothetical protein
MVHDRVWEEAWTGRLKPWHELPGQAVLCIGCLEQRLGRTLCARDFTDAMVNYLDKENISERMRRRLEATESRRLEPLDYPRDDPPPPEYEDEGPPKRKRGRPKGSKNKPKPPVDVERVGV